MILEFSVVDMDNRIPGHCFYGECDDKDAHTAIIQTLNQIQHTFPSQESGIKTFYIVIRQLRGTLLRWYRMDSNTVSRLF